VKNRNTNKYTKIYLHAMMLRPGSRTRHSRTGPRTQLSRPRPGPRTDPKDYPCS